MAKNNNNLKEHEEPKEYKGTDMESEIKAINELIKDSKEVKTPKSNISKYVNLGLWSIGAMLISNEVLAAMNIGEAIKEALDPVKQAILDYWKQAVGITGITTALVSAGDFRQRSMNSGIAMLIATGVILGGIKGYF